jgi:hypothetical protein
MDRPSHTVPLTQTLFESTHRLRNLFRPLTESKEHQQARMRAGAAQQELAVAKLNAEAASARKQKTLYESAGTMDFFLSAYVDLLDRYRDGPNITYPLTQPQDRRYGQNYPFWVSEQQLSLVRAQARLMTAMNPYAIGLLTGLASFVIGSGFTYRAMPKKGKENVGDGLLSDVQEAIDEFAELNDWEELQQELFWRTREDGEYFLRFFDQVDGGILVLRVIEPEQITLPPGGRFEEYSFGIKTDPEDVMTRYKYFSHYKSTTTASGDVRQNGSALHNAGASELGEEIDADCVQHMYVNTKKSIKRGLTDFSFGVFDCLRAAQKLVFNFGEGAAIQASIAQIRQWDNASASSVQQMAGANTTYSVANPITGQAINYQQLEPGQILDIPRQLQYVPPPAWQGGAAESFISLLHAELRGAGTRWNAPEWLATASGADMAAYTASLTAESPFVKTAARYQRLYVRVFRDVVKRAVATAAMNDLLPQEAVDLVDIECTPPRIEMRDSLEEAQANQIRVVGGWKAPQQVCEEEGRQWDETKVLIEEYHEDMGTVLPQFELPKEDGPDAGTGVKKIPMKGGADTNGDTFRESLTEDFDPAKHPRGQPENKGVTRGA